MKNKENIQEKIKKNNSRRLKDYKDLVNYSISNYADKIAYKYKENPTDKEIIEKTYKQAGKDIKALATAFLCNDWENSKIALIGKNRYEWV